VTEIAAHPRGKSVKITSALFCIVLLTACQEDEVSTQAANAGAPARFQADGPANAMSGSRSSAPTAVDIQEALASLEADLNPRVYAACGAGMSDLVAGKAEGTTAGECVDLIAIVPEPCERVVYPQFPQDAQRLLVCVRRDEEAMLECCTKLGTCTPAAIEACYEILWHGADAGPCDVDFDVFDAALDRCESGHLSGND